MLHTCTYVYTVHINRLSQDWWHGCFLRGRGRKIYKTATVCVWQFVLLCLPELRAYLIENVTAFMKLSICNTNTPQCRTHTNMQVLTTYIWHIYIQLVSDIFAQKRKCKFPPHTHTQQNNRNGKKAVTHTHAKKRNQQTNWNGKSGISVETFMVFSSQLCTNNTNNNAKNNKFSEKCINNIYMY